MEQGKAVHLLADLLDISEKLTEFIQDLHSAVRNSRRVDAVASVDAAIDQWNVLINRAPVVLKAVKQDYLGIK